MNFFDFTKDAQKFFKDKIHALNNAIAHEDDATKISKLKMQLRYAEVDWKKYMELHEKMMDSIETSNQLEKNSDKYIQYCKTHFWLL